jgi:hypothetical protein
VPWRQKTVRMQPAEPVTDHEQREQHQRQDDAHGQRLDGTGRLPAIVQQEVHAGEQAHDDDRQDDEYDDFGEHALSQCVSRILLKIAGYAAILKLRISN